MVLAPDAAHSESAEVSGGTTSPGYSPQPASHVTTRPPSLGPGIRVFGIAAILFGLTGLAFGDFASAWQPVPAGTPYRPVLSAAAALCMLAGGIGAQIRRTARIGLVLAAVPYLAFALLWSRRIVGYPHIAGTWSGTAEELVLVIAAAVAFVSLSDRDAASRDRAVRAGMVGFGLCAASFGITHFEALAETARMVPAWLPPGQRFWAIATGVGFVLAGLSAILDLWSLLAVRLLVAMLVSIGITVWIPRIFTAPRGHMTWAGNAIHLAVTGAAWILADAIATREAPRRGGAPPA